MIKSICFLACFLLSAVWTHVYAQNEQAIIGYVYGSEPTPEQIRSLTHIILCFVAPDGVEGAIKNTYGAVKTQKVAQIARDHGVKTLMSFGGGGCVITEELVGSPLNRSTFVSNLVQFVEDYNLDGLDCDWEPDFTVYDGGDESINYQNNLVKRKFFNPLLREVRDSLDARFGVGEKLLSVAVGATNTVWYATPEYAADNIVYPTGLWEHVDFINFMTYGGDNNGDFDAVFGAKGAIAFWSDLGMPKEKMVMGIPFYAASG